MRLLSNGTVTVFYAIQFREKLTFTPTHQPQIINTLLGLYSQKAQFRNFWHFPINKYAYMCIVIRQGKVISRFFFFMFSFWVYVYGECCIIQDVKCLNSIHLYSKLNSIKHH